MNRKLTSRSRYTNHATNHDPTNSIESSVEYPSKKLNMVDGRLTARFSFVEPKESLDSLLDNDVERTIDLISSSQKEVGGHFTNHNDDNSPLRNHIRNMIPSFESSPQRRHSILRKDKPSRDIRRQSLGEMMCDAASSGDLSRIGRLLGAGADPKRKSKEGFSPVHLAAAGGHLCVLKSLVMHGARLDATDNLGRTPLHMAVIERQPTIVSYLACHGAPIDAKDVNGCTALHLAAQLEAEQAPTYLDAEGESNNKVRFSYVFGHSSHSKRASISSISSSYRTPLEALLRAGAEFETTREIAHL